MTFARKYYDSKLAHINVNAISLQYGKVYPSSGGDGPVLLRDLVPGGQVRVEVVLAVKVRHQVDS